jgi:glutamyl-tRNA synthetase
MNGEYLKKMSLEEFHALSLPYYNEIADKGLNLFKISELLHTRMETLGDIPAHIDFFEALPEYSIELYLHKKMKTTYENSLESLERILPVLETLEPWTNETLYAAMMKLVEEIGIKNGQLLWPARTALSGKPSSPGGASELAEILGREETINRIKAGIEKLKNDAR